MSKDDLGAKTYPDLLLNRTKLCPDKIAYQYPPPNDEGDWLELTWAQSLGLANKYAAGFVALGLAFEQRTAIISSTRIEWIFADFGIAFAGGATTTVYPNTVKDEVAYILQHCDAVMAVVENRVQLKKITDNHDLDEQIKKIIIIDDDRVADDLYSERVIGWDEFARLGAQYLSANPDCVNERLAKITPDMISTLIYTSGTTGQPKGVEIMHSNWVAESKALVEMIGHLFDEKSSVYLWLPFSHVFGRDLIALTIGVNVVSAVDGRVDKIMDGLLKVKPTVLVGVPRIFEKVRSAVMTLYPNSSLKGRISRWAFAVGRDSRAYRLKGEKLPAVLNLKYKIADRLVFSTLRQRLGGRMEFMISGSAKLSERVQAWFYSAGITLIEGYGLTETAAVAFLNPPSETKFGSIGRPVPGLEAKVSEEGELLLKGPTVARRYHKSQEETDAAFKDGWFHTGDAGEFDEDGDFFITDRIKDLLKTSNGKYVAPQKIENAIIANIPYVSQAVAIGEGRKFVSALMVLDKQAAEKWAKNRGLDLSYEEIIRRPEIIASLDRMVRKTNENLERWEQIKRYRIMDREFSQEEGELTTSLKLRRAVVNRQYADLIEEIYQDESKSNLTVER